MVVHPGAGGLGVVCCFWHGAVEGRAAVEGAVDCDEGDGEGSAGDGGCVVCFGVEVGAVVASAVDGDD